MRYLSVCSGVEAATLAWHGLGWTPAAFSEIDKFPSAVLAHHWPDVANLGNLEHIRVDTSAKLVYSITHGQKIEKLPGGDCHVRGWFVCAGCSGVLWGESPIDVGLAEAQGYKVPTAHTQREGQPLPSWRETLRQIRSRRSGACPGKGYIDSPYDLRGVRHHLCACEQPTADRGASLRLQQAAGGDLDVSQMPLQLARAEHCHPPVIDVIDLGNLVGGFPCQDLSVAGKRKGLKHNGRPTRSGLFYRISDIAEAIGQRWTTLENVPGLLSSATGRDFAAVVGELAGSEVSVPRDGWGNSGFALGPRGLVEWGILDAQYFGVPQRRRRVFIIRDSGDWRNRPPILLERESMSGHPAPSREKGKDVALATANCLRGRGNDPHRADTGNYVTANRMTAFGEYVNDGTASTCKQRD